MTTTHMTDEPTSSADPDDAASDLGVGSSLRGSAQQLLALGGLLMVWVFFAIMKGSTFMPWANQKNILFSTVVVGLLAIGTTIVIVAGGIDLSIGTGMTLCAVMSGVFIVNLGIPLLIGIPMAVLFGGLIGLVNGALVSVLGFPPFIATLAMMQVAQGLSLVLSDAAPIYFESSYGSISTSEWISGLPNAIAVFALASIAAGLILGKTVLGRYAYSIGSNEPATALSGINVKRWNVMIYAYAGLFTGLAGVMISARLGSSQPAVGLGYELQAIAAVIIGGTSLAGGKGTIAGTVIGAILISTLNNGLQLMSIPQQWQLVILGLVILLAVFADNLRTRGS